MVIVTTRCQFLKQDLWLAGLVVCNAIVVFSALNPLLCPSLISEKQWSWLSNDQIVVSIFKLKKMFFFSISSWDFIQVIKTTDWIYAGVVCVPSASQLQVVGLCVSLALLVFWSSFSRLKAKICCFGIWLMLQELDKPHCTNNLESIYLQGLELVLETNTKSTSNRSWAVCSATPLSLYNVTHPQGSAPPSTPPTPLLHHANTQMDANVSFGHEKLSGLICTMRPEDTAKYASIALPTPCHVHVKPVPFSTSCLEAGEGSGSAAGVSGGTAVFPPNVLRSLQ